MSRIFISYRREDSQATAGRISDRLVKEFGHSEIFMDVDSIGVGVDFVQAIEEAVTHCNVLIAVIGRQWLTLTDKKGRRMLDQPNDFVRIEIRAALERKVPIIPVLVEHTPMPDTEDLPEDLQALVRRNALEVTHTRFTSDMDRLVGRLQQLFDDDAWSRAGQLNTITAYKKYLATAPEGKFRKEAKKEMIRLQQQQQPEESEPSPREPEAEAEAAKSVRRRSIIKMVITGLTAILAFYFVFRNTALQTLFDTHPGDTASKQQPAASHDSTNTQQASVIQNESLPKETGPVNNNNKPKENTKKKIAAEYKVQKDSMKEDHPKVVIMKDSDKVESTVSNEKIYARTEIPAAFPGGTPGWKKYLQRNLRYPQEAADKNIEGTVVVRFIVEKEGSLNNIEVISGPVELRREAIRVVRQSGKWLAGYQNGRAVRSYFSQAISFGLTGQ